MVVRAEQYLRADIAREQHVERRIVQRPRRLTANDLDRQLLLVHRLPDTGQTALRNGVVLPPHDKRHLPVAPVEQVICGDLPRLFMVHVHPAYAAALIRLADHKIRKIDTGQNRRQLCRENMRMEEQCVRLPLLNNVADDYGRFLPRKRLEQKRIPLFLQIRGGAGDDLEHMRVFKRYVPVKVRDEQHRPARLPGKALRSRVGSVAEPAGDRPDPFLCLLRNGAAVVQRLGDRGNGNVRFPRHIINRYRRRSAPPTPRIPMRRLCHGFLPFSRGASRALLTAPVPRRDSS